METLLEDVFYRVAAGSMVFVEGKKGSGKSSILWNLIKKYRGKGKVIYFDCAQIEKELNIEKLLVNKYGFIRGRILNKKPRDMILLLDNIEELSKRKYLSGYEVAEILEKSWKGDLPSCVLPKKEHVTNQTNPRTAEEAVYEGMMAGMQV